MALPTKTNLTGLDFVWLGNPFCQTAAKSIDLKTLDPTWLASPYSRNAFTAPAQTVTCPALARSHTFHTHQLSLAVTCTLLARSHTLGAHQLNLTVTCLLLARSHTFGSPRLTIRALMPVLSIRLLN